MPLAEDNSGRLFSEGSMSELLSSLDVSGGEGGGKGLLALLGSDNGNKAVDESEETKEESSENRTTMEEEEDEAGSKRTRKVTSSRQTFSTSSNSSSLLTSSSSDGKDAASVALLQKLLNVAFHHSFTIPALMRKGYWVQEQKGKGKGEGKVTDEEDGSLKVTETTSFRVGGSSNRRTLFETLEGDDWPPKGAPIPTQNHSFTG